MFGKKKTQKEADGIWRSDESRITNECKQVYPALYSLQRFVLLVTAVVWIIELVTPTVFQKLIPGYAAWGNTYEKIMMTAALVMLVLYIIANYFWQKKMQQFREKYDLQKYKKQQEAARRKKEAKKDRG